MNLNIDQVGGGVVRRSFSSGGKRIASGARLSAEEIKAMPVANRQALIDKRFIEVFPKDIAAAGERHVVSAGFGKYNVIEGKKLTEFPVSKQEADAIAGAKRATKKKAATAQN